MKTILTIEQHDNGIVLRSESDGVDPTSVVILDADIHETVGKEIWYDIQQAMNCAMTNKVQMNIEYLRVQRKEDGGEEWHTQQ